MTVNRKKKTDQLRDEISALIKTFKFCASRKVEVVMQFGAQMAQEQDLASHRKFLPQKRREEAQ